MQRAPAEITAESKSRSRALCRFFGTKKGCRAGDQCPYRHAEIHKPSPLGPSTALQGVEIHGGEPSSSSAEGANSGQPPRLRTARRPITVKPIPSLQQTNPREFEIGQVVRRFSPERDDGENGTLLLFKLIPSDPDFPFELPGLACKLTVPKSYPQDARPTVRVSNSEMARGYQINVERGFDSIAAQNPAKTLLSMLNELDRNLEKFLTAEKAQTIKLIANANKVTTSKVEDLQPARTQDQSEPLPVSAPPAYTTEQKQGAKVRRDAEIRQLEARMSRLPLFSKSPDGTSFNLPVQIPKPARLPPALLPLKEITLNVPLLYSLEPCTIKLNGVRGADAQNVEMAFERRAREDPALTLMAHINFLTQNMHLMAVENVQVQSTSDNSLTISDTTAPKETVPQTDEAPVAEGVLDSDRPHVKLIPRPPEWEFPQNDSDDDDSSSDSYDSDEEDLTDSDEENADGGTSLPVSSSSTNQASVERGILISFPNIELFGIELLEVSSLSLILKCDRCKSNLDVKNIRPNPTNSTLTRTESCPKCSTTLSVSYRAEPIHQHSIRGGYLDLTDGSIADMLPSIFTPTCSDCSTTAGGGGPSDNNIVCVRGDTTLTVCRACHRKQTLKLPDVKFLRASSSVATTGLPRKRKTPKETLGLTTGTPLPRNGSCKHYRKSHRWFRFSCCDRVFPCDRCHDADPVSGDHANEHASRMICGLCSREQPYRPDACAVCGSSLVGRKGGGFWEGGKGTRDKIRMSRKEKRKYKRG